MTSKKKSSRQINSPTELSSRNILLIFLVVAVFGFLTLRDYLKHVNFNQPNRNLQQSTQSPKITYKTEQLKIAKVTLNVEIADTPILRERGLSYRDSLDENWGLLFIFDSADYPYFWMKDMNFPLDIIWINNNKVVDLSENTPAPKPGVALNQLPTYTPKEAVNSVLEVNAGFVAKNKIAIGDQVEISH